MKQSKLLYNLSFFLIIGLIISCNSSKKESPNEVLKIENVQTFQSILDSIPELIKPIDFEQTKGISSEKANKNEKQSNIFNGILVDKSTWGEWKSLSNFVIGNAKNALPKFQENIENAQINLLGKISLDSNTILYVEKSVQSKYYFLIALDKKNKPINCICVGYKQGTEERKAIMNTDESIMIKDYNGKMDDGNSSLITVDPKKGFYSIDVL